MSIFSSEMQDSAATKPEDKDKKKPFIEFVDDRENRPHPDYTSFVSRNASIIEQRTTNTQLSTETNTKDLKAGENPDIIKILGPDYSDQFKPPYDTVDLIRYHEVWRDDGIANASIDFLIQFMLGDHFKTIIDVNTEFDTEEEQKAALDRFAANPTLRLYKKKIDQINREIKFQDKMFSMLIHCMVFARGCGFIEKSPIDGLPTAIKILPSMHLGQVYVHRKSWKLLGVEHKDWKFPQSIFKAEDILYFPMRDHNVSPGTLWYGYSLVERIVDLSELNRINNQRNFKEINYRMWAAFLLIKLVGSYNDTYMQELRNQITKGAGNSIIANQQVMVEVHQIESKMKELLEQRNENYREEIRQFQVPVILFDPDILNRATSQELMEAWTVSVLKAYRSWLKDIIQDQWINPMLKTMIENERALRRQADDQPSAGPEPEIESPETEGLEKPGGSKELIPIEAVDPTTGEILIYRLPWKIKIEFEPHNFDTFKERAETAILLKNNGLATTRTALKIIGVTDEEEIAALVELEEKRQQLRFSQVQGQPVAKELQAEEKNEQRSIERQRERIKESLQKTINPSEPVKQAIRPSRKPPE